jgi:protein gp37
MTDVTAIEWTDHTFNPWWGCSRVSPACVNCYADQWAKRWGYSVWRRQGPRRMLSEANWQKPYKWNRQAMHAGVPEKVFSASMADIFEDHPQLPEPRKTLFEIIEDTPWLRWQLLTKRIENVAGMAPWGSNWPPNVWLGTSVENQGYAVPARKPSGRERIPTLLAIPAAVHFLSCEPMLSPIELPEDKRLNWVIAGGESGAKARRSASEWFTSLQAQCNAQGIAFFMKQTGVVLAQEWGLESHKGRDPEEWPVAWSRDFPADPIPSVRN